MKYRTSRNTSTEPTGTGSFVHEHINTASEPENRPPPASILASWVTGEVERCTDAVCEDRLEGFYHRHVRGFPLAEHWRTDELDAEELDPGSPWNIAGVDR